MSRNRRYNPYRDQSYKKDFETENKIDLDDKNEVATDKEVDPIEALMSDKKTLEDIEGLLSRKYLKSRCRNSLKE